MSLSHVLTVKIPEDLLYKIEKTCGHSHSSKGSLVRKALLHFFDSDSSPLITEASDPSEDLLKKITQDLLKGKKPRIKADGNQLKLKASQSPLNLKPEEEVLYYRRRGL